MKVTLDLTAAQAAAVLRAELSAGAGVRRSQALQTAEFRLTEAILAAQRQAVEAKQVTR